MRSATPPALSVCVCRPIRLIWPINHRDLASSHHWQSAQSSALRTTVERQGQRQTETETEHTRTLLVLIRRQKTRLGQAPAPAAVCASIVASNYYLLTLTPSLVAIGCTPTSSTTTTTNGESAPKNSEKRKAFKLQQQLQSKLPTRVQAKNRHPSRGHNLNSSHFCSSHKLKTASETESRNADTAARESPFLMSFALAFPLPP